MVRRKRDDDSSNVTFNSSSYGGAGGNMNGVGIISGIFQNNNSSNNNNDYSSPTFNNPSSVVMDGAASIAAESQPSLAFDASSMSATGSFGGGPVQGTTTTRRGRRPYKRQRKTLTDALQQINLNRDVPLQILEGVAVAAASAASASFGGGGINNCGTISDIVDGDDSSLLVNRGTSSSGGRDIDDSFYEDDDDDGDYDDNEGASGLLLGLNGGGDYDDNSQLTASDDVDDDQDGYICVIKAETPKKDDGGEQSVPVDNNMDVADDDDADADDGDDEDETDMSNNNVNSMTDAEKAQRRAMLDLLLGKSRTVTFPGMEKPVVSKAISVVDRQIEDLLRRSLQNVQQGVHPLTVKPTTPTNDDDDDDDDDDISQWQSQDDMAIDPRIYHSYQRPTNTTGGMTTDRNNNNNNNNNIQTFGSIFPPPIRTRKRSNSLPRSMDLDNEYENRQSTVEKKRSRILDLSPPIATTWVPSPDNYGVGTDQSINNPSSCTVTSIGTSDVAMD